jgi:uncharacterized protein YfbU (UPF0304 family)
MSITNRLKLFREGQGISQAELARCVGVSRQALSAVEAGKQDPSLPVALKIARALDFSLQQIFFLEDDAMVNAKTVMLTQVERLALVNQYKVLQALHKDDDYLVKHYQALEEIFAHGYVELYGEAFGQLSDETPMKVSDEVISILEMHQAMLTSLGQIPKPADLERVKFRGFDANSESEQFRFAKFFTEEGDKYRAIQIFNSHMPTLERYRRMLAEWEHFGRRLQLTKPQIESILDAGT